ncbi:MAG: proline--tRNA ligase, partial [Gammaproteobacteria bacterium]|nr:proline--tRNA ligase [Gammaproteobacteria bacterium]
EDNFVHCEQCDYAANVEAGQFVRSEARFGEPAPLEKTHTPDCHTIAQLCEYLGISAEQTLKLVMYTFDLNTPDEKVVMALVRGDL